MGFVETNARMRRKIVSELDLLPAENYRKTRAQGVADFNVGDAFCSDETGEMRRYERVAVAPGYSDLGNNAAPANRAMVDALTDAQGSSYSVATVADIGALKWNQFNPRPATIRCTGRDAVGDRRSAEYRYIGKVDANFLNRKYRVRDADGNVWTKITQIPEYPDNALRLRVAAQEARNAPAAMLTVLTNPKRRFDGDLNIADTSFITAPKVGMRYWPRDSQPLPIPAGASRLFDTGLVVEKRRPNLIPYSDFSGAVVGIVGAGGSLPTGSSKVTTDIMEIISVGPDANGIPTMVFELRRTGGVPARTGTGWRVRDYGDPIAVSAGMGAGFHGFVRVISSSGVSAASFLLQEEKADASRTFVQSHTYPLRLDGQQDRAIVHAVPVLPTNRFVGSVAATYSSTTGDGRIRFEVKAMKIEECLDPKDITTWTPNGKTTSVDPNLASQTGAVVGVVGSGGKLPDGWDRNNAIGVVEVLQAAPLRIKISRTGGAVGEGTALRPVSYNNRVQNTSGSAADFALKTSVRVVAATGIATFATNVQELSATDAFVNATSSAIPLDGTTANVAPLRSIPNNSKTIAAILLTSSAADWSLTFEFSELPSFGRATVAYPAALVETPAVACGVSGSFDVLQLGAGASQWRPNTAIANTLALQLPEQRSLQLVKQVILLPTGSTFQTRLDTLDALNPMEFEPLIIDPYERQASVAGYMCGVDGPMADWSMKRAKNRKRVIRYECRPGDHDPRDVIQDGGNTSRERVELRVGYDWQYDTDQWIAWSWMILPGDPVVEDKISGDFCSLGQIHDGTIAGEKNYSNSLGTGLYQDDRWGLFAAHNPNSTTTAGYRKVIEYQDQDPTPRGVMQNMVARFRFSLSGNGRIQVWKNGILVVDYTGPVGFSGSPGLYWKEGIYRGQRPSTLAVLFANLEFGADLSAFIGNPRDIA